MNDLLVIIRKGIVGKVLEEFESVMRKRFFVELGSKTKQIPTSTENKSTTLEIYGGPVTKKLKLDDDQNHKRTKVINLLLKFCRTNFKSIEPLFF